MHHYGSGPEFAIGTSDAAKDWPAMQPGSVNPAFGGKPHPFTIHFQLPKVEAGSYRLKVGLIISSQRIARLEVTLNRHRGEFCLHRATSFDPGNPGLDSPIYGESRLDLDLPARDLRSGGNVLVLTTINPAEDGPGNPAIAYDALEMDHAAEKAAAVWAALSGQPDFGEQRFRLELPAWTGARPAVISLTLDGQKIAIHTSL